MSTQEMRTSSADNARNIPRNIEDFYNAELLERIIEDGAIPTEKVEGGPTATYIATITQTGTNVPVVTEILNTTGATVTPSRGAIGNYRLTFSAAVLVVGSAKATIDPGTVTDLASVVKAYVASTTEIQLLTGSNATTPADAELTNAVLRVDVYV